MKENSIAILTGAYTSPLLINTLTREEVPVYTKINKLRIELGRYCSDLILLDENEASRIISKDDSLLYTNSDKGLAAINEIFGNLRGKVDHYMFGHHVETKKRRDEEFVCDAYFDSNGRPVVLGIYAHPILDENDFRDIVYYTSRKVMIDMLPLTEKSLGELFSQMDLKNLPLHARFNLFENNLKIDEIHLGSFGSFSVSDLLFFAFGVNPYKLYFTGQEPDWEGLLSSAVDSIFFRVLGRLPPELQNGESPDHELFADTFDDLIGYCKLDIERYPAFSIGFGRTDDMEKVRNYLRMDFRDFLT